MTRPIWETHRNAAPGVWLPKETTQACTETFGPRMCASAKDHKGPHRNAHGEVIGEVEQGEQVDVEALMQRETRLREGEVIVSAKEWATLKAELRQAEQREKGLREALEGVDDAYEAWRTVPGESIQVVAEAAYKARLALASPEPPDREEQE